MLRFKPKEVPINTVNLLFSIQADFSHRGLENSLVMLKTQLDLPIMPAKSAEFQSFSATDCGMRW